MPERSTSTSATPSGTPTRSAISSSPSTPSPTESGPNPCRWRSPRSSSEEPEMPLPAPYLDDRHFQDLVDQAKRLVQQRCPEWTDHNVSDPGVTLIEAFAMMVDQLMYRLNRVPELHYLRFLDLIGVTLLPPTAARCDVTFWLSSAQETVVGVPAGAQVAAQSDGGEPVVFRTDADLAMVPCDLSRVMTVADRAEPVDRTDDLRSGRGFSCFGDVPGVGDSVLFGLSAAVPRCAVLIRLECHA